MIGALIPVMIQGMVLSSLFALCISKYAAEPGTTNKLDPEGLAGIPGFIICTSPLGATSVGTKSGDEKESK